MAKIKDYGEGRYGFYCPGCQHEHIYYVNSPHWTKDSQGWTFNGDFNNPTFSPSLLITWGRYADPNWQEPDDIAPGQPSSWSGQCHLFVQNGVINYCSDCTHEYNCRQGVAMKEYLDTE